ncbi:MAG: hypothetical protein GY749_41755 [Desulfobacteraceae bacterium]|nr:hypothetical protein [Desulfobacteraceae bacterium]
MKLPLLLNRDLYIPNNAVSLTFDYNLNVETGNENYFDFYFDNLSGPYDSAGGHEGVYTGTITKNVTAFAGSTLSLAFFFNFGWDDFRFDSTLEITNARIITVP